MPTNSKAEHSSTTKAQNISSCKQHIASFKSRKKKVGLVYSPQGTTFNYSFITRCGFLEGTVCLSGNSSVHVKRVNQKQFTCSCLQYVVYLLVFILLLPPAGAISNYNQSKLQTHFITFACLSSQYQRFNSSTVYRITLLKLGYS